jgi:3-oxoacyl-[acyl-carrier protein] reductase
VRLGLDKRCAIVTGGARGIGRAIAAGLASAGATVHVIDRHEPADAGGRGMQFHSCDITDTKAIQAMLERLATPASILVNNAGITRDRTLMKMDDSEWSDVIAVNLTGAFNMMRAVAPAMVSIGGGRIINVTSINGIRGKVGQANYAASKAGLIGLTKTAARELGRKGITVNAVAPGMVMTEMARALPTDILDRAIGETVLNQLAEPADIAAAVVFLASDAARMITGQVLQVDAGQYI